MDDIYKEQIVDHYKNPRNFGPPWSSLAEGEKSVTVKEANSSCGDLFELSLKLKVKDKKLKVIGVRFRGVGCALSTAAFSMLTERINPPAGGAKLKIRNLRGLKDEDMLRILGIRVSPGRMKCVTLPLRALTKALEAGGCNDK